MNIFNKKETIIDNISTHEVEAAKVWVLSWNAYESKYEGNPHLTNMKRVAKAFLSEKDAIDYKNTLIAASALIQCDNLGFEFEIEEQK